MQSPKKLSPQGSPSGESNSDGSHHEQEVESPLPCVRKRTKVVSAKKLTTLVFKKTKDDE
jgi:hypothetical protein